MKRAPIQADNQAADVGRQHRVSKWITLTLPVLSVILLFVTGEAAVRFYHFLRFDISIVDGKPRHPRTVTRLSPITLDGKLGWRATENYRFDGIKHNSDGTEYPVHVTQDSRGFRMFGNPSSGRPRILVIGDSFTEAVDASDNATYFAVLKQVLGAEVFAYGTGGYGSLQELMILDKYFDLIHPDLIVWQFSANDIVNNSLEMETASTINNNGMIRPYWLDHRIRYALPTKDSAGVREFALRYSRIGYMILNRIDRLRASDQHSVETATAVGKAAHPMFVRALRTTDEIMRKVRERAGTVPIVAFVVGDETRVEYFEGFTEISRHNSIVQLNGIQAAVLREEKHGTVVRAADGSHWNETGHRIAGRAIAERLMMDFPTLAANSLSHPGE